MYHISFPQRSNRASWAFIGLITDLNDNPIDLTGCSMVFQVSPKRGNAEWGVGYGDWGYSRASGALMASTDNGKITFIALGTFRWFFTLDEMRSLCTGTYNTGLTLTSADGTQTVQLSIGPLAIIDGVVQ